MKLPRSFVHELTARCDLACAHCYCPWTAAGAEVPRELSLDEIGTIVERVAALGRKVENVTLTGGEPTLRADLPDIIALYRRRVPSARVNMATNGLRLDGELARSLAGAGAATVQITMLGPSPELHDRLVGRPGAFDRTLRAVNEAKLAGMAVAVFFVALRDNCEQLGATACLALAVGADAVVFNRVNPGGRGLQGFEARTPLPGQLAAAMQQARELKLGARLSFGTALPPLEAESPMVWRGCPVGTKDAYPAIGPDGRLRACNHDPVSVGSLLEASFEALLPRCRAYEPAEECAGCAQVRRCHGGCPAARALAGRPVYACQTRV